MLPKSRVMSILLVGLGVAVMVAGIVTPNFIARDGRLPLNLENTTWTLRDDSATTRLMTDPHGRVLEMPVTYQLHMEVQQPSSRESTGVRLGESLLRESAQTDQDRLITASTWSYQMDRLSGEALTPASYAHTIGMPPVEVPVDGLWMKFPSYAEQSNYLVFNSTLNRSFSATYIDSEERRGRTLYHYRQVIPPTQVTDGLFTTADFNGHPAPRWYASTQDFWVDKVTGLVVDMSVSIDDYFAYTPNHEYRQQVLLFDAVRDPDQAAAALEEVTSVSSRGTSQFIRWTFIILGIALTLMGLLGAFTEKPRWKEKEEA